VVTLGFTLPPQTIKPLKPSNLSQTSQTIKPP
jgi:hypothetical protein